MVIVNNEAIWHRLFQIPLQIAFSHLVPFFKKRNEFNYDDKILSNCSVNPVIAI